ENGSKLGIVVDELIGQQQVVIKSLQENFDQVPGISGATIMGNGKVSLILDVEQLSRIAEHAPQPSAAQAQDTPDAGAGTEIDDTTEFARPEPGPPAPVVPGTQAASS